MCEISFSFIFLDLPPSPEKMQYHLFRGKLSFKNSSSEMSLAGVIIKDVNPLSLSYVPPSLPHREKEVSRIIEYLEPFLYGGHVTKVILTGGSGVGKTVLSKFISRLISQKISEHYRGRFKSIYVNARLKGSSFNILNSIASSLGISISLRGLSNDEVLSSLIELIQRKSLLVLLVLDELDFLIDIGGSNILYSFFRLHELTEGEGNAAIIMILRNPSYLSKLDRGVLHTIHSPIIRLSPYSSLELTDILSQRVKYALHPGRISSDALNLIAEESAKYGDARYAIEILWKSAIIAEYGNKFVISPEDVREAFFHLPYIPYKDDLSALSHQELLLLLAISNLSSEKSYVSLSEVEEEYVTLCQDFGATPRKHTQIWKYINRLSSLGFITRKVSSRGRDGRVTVVSLRIPTHSLSRQLHSLLEGGS